MTSARCGSKAALRASTLVRGPSCTTSWRRAVDLFHPDVVLFVLSGAGQREARLGGNWVHSCQPAFDQNLAQGFRHAISTLSARGQRWFSRLLPTPEATARPPQTIVTSTATTGFDARLPPPPILPSLTFSSGPAVPMATVPSSRTASSCDPTDCTTREPVRKSSLSGSSGNSTRGVCSSQTSSRNASTTSFRRFESAAASRDTTP